MFTNDVLIDGQPIDVGGTVAVSAVSGTVTVDGSGVTQPVSGSVSVSAVSGTVTVDGSGVTQPVSGSVSVSAVSGTVTVDGSGVTQPVSGTFWQTTQPVSGTLAVTEAGASSSTVNQLVLTASTNATVWVANPARLGAILVIPTATVGNPTYVKLGATASATSWTYKAVSNNTTIEIPKAWLGQVDIFAVTAQTINRTEY
jgi:hypothetical protein